ncbi:MAG: Mrp/NBP35 family ATP-binding protein [Deinococcus sp.]|nr:Mrp/NBP35 family ATP-binding protein [Deinococcus sp.]
MSPAVTEAVVLQALQKVRDPDLGRDIVSLGFVKDLQVRGANVAFTIELTTPACPVRDKMKEEARQQVATLPGVKQVEVTMTSQVRAMASQRLLPGVKNIVPVASGKGGVGKSTVSANLALALARTGAKVGLMDADVYGPSIPTIMGIREAPRQVGNKILPVEQYGVKVISMGFFIQEDQAVIWRGPMLAKMIEQFLGGVEWGDLDYLVVDLPPGTGDVQLSLCQQIPLTGAVVVSTPQDVAIKVAQKAIMMFQKLNCPVLGMIENMSYYVCPHCAQREEIFSSGGAQRAAERLKIPYLGAIPLATAMRSSSDNGRPIVLSEPDSPLAEAFMRVAENMAAQISIRNMQGQLIQDIQITF